MPATLLVNLAQFVMPVTLRADLAQLVIPATLQTVMPMTHQRDSMPQPIDAAKKCKECRQLKISVEPPLHGDVSKPCKKTNNTMAVKHIYINTPPPTPPQSPPPEQQPPKSSVLPSVKAF
jgi:hypothetical protein